MATKKPKTTKKSGQGNISQDIEDVIKKSVEPLTTELLKMSVKVDSLQNKADNLDSKMTSVTEKTRTIDEKIDRESKPEEKKYPLWFYVSQLVTILGVIAAIILNLSQASQVGPTKEKTVAETQKIYTEELKTRAELEKLLGDLATEKSKGLDAYEEQLNRVLPELQSTIERLNKLDSVSSRYAVVENLYKNMLIGMFLTAVFFFLQTFSIVWSWLTSTLLSAFYSFRPKWTSKNEGRRKRYENIQKYVGMFSSMLGNVPAVVILLVEIYIFTALSVPLFDSVSSSLGIDLQFASVLEHLWKFDLSGAVDIFKKALFSL
jgi:tetrahydromethanopterin S-methyltransferase subunit B